MKLCGAVFGGLFGWALTEFEVYGLVLGGLVGLLAGLWAENTVRRLARETLKQIVDAELKGFIARQIAAELDARGAGPAVPDRPVAAPPPVPAAARAEPESPAVSQPLPEPVVPPDAPAPVRPDARLAPLEPNIIERAIAAARGWLLGGNTIVRVGLVILFVGLSFLARYAANAGLFPIELRLAAVGAVGAALLGVGFNRRVQRPEFGLALQGAGVGVLYLTVFAGASPLIGFHVMPPLVAFGLMIVIAALGCALALLQDSKLMALAAFAGGFAVPVLLGGESRTPLPLFAYGTVLNLAILTIARSKSWRELNLLGFFATFAIAGAWGAARYAPEHFWVCQVFLAITVAIYLLTALLYAHNTPGRFGLAADSTLLFGTAIVGFGLQTRLVEHIPYAQAWAALAFGAVYVGLAAWVWRRPRAETRLLGECLIAIAVGFVTLAIPLALEVRWAGAAWALEGAGAFWVGKRQARWMPRAFGMALVALAALTMLATLEANVAALPLFNTGFIGALLIAGPLLAIAWWLRQPLLHSGSRWAERYAPIEARLERPAFLSGFLFACLALVQEVSRLLPPVTTELGPVPVFPAPMQQLLAMLAVVAAMWLSLRAARRFDWSVAARPALLSLPLLGVTLLIQAAAGHHVFDWPDLLPWLAALALHFDILRTGDGLALAVPGRRDGDLRNWLHAGTVWLLTGVLANTLFLGIDRAGLWHTSWAGVAFLVAATLVLLGLTRIGDAARSRGAAVQRWPLAGRTTAYAWTAALPLAVLVYGGALITAVAAQGITAPLPYVPLVNPVDLAVLLALAVLALWHRMASAIVPPPDGADLLRGAVAPALAAVLGFVAVNAIWLRTAHHWLGIDWHGPALAASAEVQTGISILWTLLAMALMIFAKRQALRPVWLLGAALLGLVVAKLLLVDMSSAEGWQRIVTFIAVGILMLVIGYFVPLPPRKADQAEAAQ